MKEIDPKHASGFFRPDATQEEKDEYWKKLREEDIIISNGLKLITKHLNEKGVKVLVKRNISWRELLDKCIILALVSGTFGIALKLSTFLNKLVYFPFFPNILDWIFISGGAIYLGYRAWSHSNE